MKTLYKILGGVGVVISVVTVVAVLMTLPTYYLWNWLMPTIFNLPKLTLWQALGINILSGILFKSSSNN